MIIKCPRCKKDVVFADNYKLCTSFICPHCHRCYTLCNVYVGPRMQIEFAPMCG